MPVRYGRGKFEAHENYIKYMEETVRSKAYEGMPNAISEDGRVNWQVSSGKTTSFYDYYPKRFEWWVKKADELGLLGKGNSHSRFSIAARLIHPTGRRPCRLCGKYLYVGYMYVNDRLANKLNKIVGYELFQKNQEITEVCKTLLKRLGKDEYLRIMKGLFKKRCQERDAELLADKSAISAFFLGTDYIRSAYLSPGFMANPPDRLDGFHDYGLCCRKEKDPGRSDENLRSYQHDRRAFKWWAEGDWNVTDSLYNSAGPGECDICSIKVDRISPDHVGPLSCGFKQIPFLIPLCRPCNASRNRRMRTIDIQRLIQYEQDKKISVASWQVRRYWDLTKKAISTDREAKRMSNFMRSIQDYYLRVLHRFWERRNAHFISYFLSPFYAHYDIYFEGLDPSTLRYQSFHRKHKKTKLRKSLAARSVRIAYEELKIYCSKPLKSRKFPKLPISEWEEPMEDILELAESLRASPLSERWMDAVDTSKDVETREYLISKLLEEDYQETIKTYNGLKTKLVDHFNWIGENLASYEDQ